MRKVKFLFRVFSMVTSCVVIAVALFTTVIHPADSLNPMILWQIPAVSMLCTLGCLIYPWDVVMSGKEVTIRILLHYFYINGVVLVSGWLFDWYNVNSVKSVLGMVITIAIIFTVVSVISWGRGAAVAKRMNEKLQQYQRGKGDESCKVFVDKRSSAMYNESVCEKKSHEYDA